MSARFDFTCRSADIGNTSLTPEKRRSTSFDAAERACKFRTMNELIGAERSLAFASVEDRFQIRACSRNMAKRHGSNPKRRIAPAHRLDVAARAALAARISYVGSAIHKSKPGNYRFQPPMNPRPWKSICDGLRVVLLRRRASCFAVEFSRGCLATSKIMRSPSMSGAWTTRVRFTKLEIIPGSNSYKGYRLEEEDAMRATVLKEWKARNPAN